MSNAATNRNRWIPAAPKAPLRQAIEFVQRSDVWIRVGLCFLVTTIVFIVNFGWNAPFPYRLREAPLRNVHAYTEFEFDDYRATDEERNRVRRNFLNFYENDQQKLRDVRAALINDLFKIIRSEYGEGETEKIWPRFVISDAEEAAPKIDISKESFNQFRQALSSDEKLDKLKEAVEKAFIGIDRNGLLTGLTHDVGQGNMQEIMVYPKGNFDDRRRVNVSQVRIGEISEDLKRRLREEIANQPELADQADLIAERIFNWLNSNLPTTLARDIPRSRAGSDKAAAEVETKKKIIAPGDPLVSDRVGYESRVIQADVPLNDEDIQLLRAEHEARLAKEGFGTKVIRSTFYYGLYAAVFLLVCQYLYFRDPNLLKDLRQFSILLGLICTTLVIAWLLSLNDNWQWRSEIIPIAVFSMTIAIAYHIELALLLGALVSLAFSVSHGYGLSEFVILTAASSTSALLCRRIRSRTKLVNVGMIVAVVVLPTVVGVQYMLGQPLGWALLTDALWFAGGAGIAGLVMTVLLPFLERWFDIQTDISLLELSDANHPLLKELVQRAPGTYNHSINVASISEAAADAIGANGLLCRVGAYFHDVGKLRKPEYFIENQAGGVNKHDDLVPTMSTLVIIAHVKDGAEIARKHRLPRRIIDLIEQHHGTTLVEYFYRRAEKQLQEQEDDDEATVDESDYRYPGPKPQTPEAAVMMVADAVESASRALREPAPARIENLVHEIARKKFEDGQFDECQITIEQLHTIQESLIKSLNAMYHARIKYPEPQPA